MSAKVWGYIQELSGSIKGQRIDEMKEFAKNYSSEKIDGPLGYQIIIDPHYLLNGDLVVRIEAIKKILFGKVIHSIIGGFEVSVDGSITDYEKPIKKYESAKKREFWESQKQS